MRDRGLIIAWIALFGFLGLSALYAELTFYGGRGGLGGGDVATGEAVQIDSGAKGSDTGAALPGAGAGGPGVDQDGPAKPMQPPQLDAPDEGRNGRETPPARVAFAGAQPPNDGRPRIAVLMSEIGLGRARSRQAIDRLPSPISFAIMAYAEDRASWVVAAREAGHEALLAVPMEPVDYPRVDPGPEPLLIDLDDTENLARFEKALRDAGGVVGVLGHMGGRFLADAERLRPILAATQDRGLIFVDGRSGADSAVAELAWDLELHVLLNDRFIDSEPSREEIDRRLVELEEIARRRGYAAGIATPYPVVIERLRSWAEGLDERGFVLAPVSAVARPPKQ